MASLSDLKLTYRLFMKGYPYRRVDWRPGANLRKPLAQARVALVTTAGLHTPTQLPFDLSIKGGDWSYRQLDCGIDLASLKMSHRSDAFDARGIAADRNVAFPLDRLRLLAREGVIGEVAPRHFSFMGSIVAPGRLMAHTAPEVARALRSDGVDAVLLIPVWPMCHQSVGLIQSIIEKAGIPTASVSVLREISERVAPPRALFADFPLGYPLGGANEVELQRVILIAMLTLVQQPVSEAILWELLAAGSIKK